MQTLTITEPRAGIATPPLSDTCMTDLLLAQVRLQGDATAVVCGAQSLTFGALADTSAAVAGHLRDLGAGADDTVGLFTEPSLDLMVGVWGIQFGGAAYLPLSPDYPEERLRYMIKHSGARIILCQESLKDRLAELTPRSTTVVTISDARSGGGSQVGLDRGYRGTDLAYVIYTSGSTGQPKGVMIDQRAIVNQMRWLDSAYGLGPSKVILQKTPMSFDAAQWEILAPAGGARVVIGCPGIHRDPDRILEAIAAHGVTTLQCVPTLLQALVDTGQLHTARSLTHIFSGGEALSKSLASRCLQALPHCRLVNLYGPTECTINSSAFTVHPAAVDDARDTISIGRPVHNTRYRILTPERVPVAVGEVGELYISGVQLARGYLRRPDLTAERFVPNPFTDDPTHATLYRTGDLAYWNSDGTVHFVGRADNQVKLRGHRIELDEIRLAIEDHDWIRHAGVIVKDDPGSSFQSLIAFIELNPAEAALMDQGIHGAHHQSKETRLQLKAQLSSPGCRGDEDKSVIELPGRAATQQHRRRVFARKTYRFYEGGEVKRADILALLAPRTASCRSRSLDSVSLIELGEILRYFGQHLSSERLLPKYGYASPGALYATQLYLELSGVAGLTPGYYYYHPVHHQLMLIRPLQGSEGVRLTVHFVGKTAAIRPVYETNVQEVLAIEAGHMVGLFDEVLPDYGLMIGAAVGDVLPCRDLDCAAEDHYLGTFEIRPYASRCDVDDLTAYVQAHPGRVTDLPAGQYLYEHGELTWVSDGLILRKDVIAINQAVYDRASFGITLVSSTQGDWLSYVALGRRLQRLMMNDLNLGFMSSGYSSETGRPLPAARRIDSILAGSGGTSGASYFFLGGRVSEEQLRSEGMKEDAVHMKGPAEMVRDDLRACLPDYMVPNRVVVLDKLPLTANGKIDTAALAASDAALAVVAERPFVAARTETEETISRIWRAVTKRERVSVHDDFFEFGGNSLMAVSLVNRINAEFASSLPLQVLFNAPTVEQLAAIVDSERRRDCSRLVPLNGRGDGRPVFCWPGLGGYPMNLRALAGRAGLGRSLYGVQAYGINEGEEPYRTIEEMATEDVKALRCLQPQGPYTLWGYSFGARVAFEAAHQLEQAGEDVDHLFLIAPGSPKVRARDGLAYRTDPAYRQEVYMTILFSVFAGNITDSALQQCLAVARDEQSFCAFAAGHFPGLDADLVRRIVEIVRRTYQFRYEFHELAQRRIAAPITIFKAQGDDYSFIENSRGYFATEPAVVQLAADHYGLLRPPGLDELLTRIRYRFVVDRDGERDLAGVCAA